MSTALIPDIPTLKISDKLELLAQTVSDCVLGGGFQGQCYGILGGYGTGKTSVMRRIKFILDHYPQRAIRTIWFDAWRYEHLDSVTQALAGVILDSASEDYGLGLIRDFIESISIEFHGISLKTGMAKKAAAPDPKSLCHFENRIGKMRGKEASSCYAVFIDDLDRCSPQKAFQLLDHLKCLFELPGFTFLVGINPGMLRPENKEQFEKASHFSVQEYLDKVMQFGFRVPAPDLDSLCRDLGDCIEGPLREAIEPKLQSMRRMMPANYRSVIKVINNWKLAMKELRDPEKTCGLGTIALKAFHPSDFDLLRRDSDAFFSLLRDAETWNARPMQPATGAHRDKHPVPYQDYRSFVEDWLGNDYRLHKAAVFNRALEVISNY